MSKLSDSLLQTNITSNVYENVNEEITGQHLQDVLTNINDSKLSRTNDLTQDVDANKTSITKVPSVKAFYDWIYGLLNGTQNYLVKYNGSGAVTNSQIQDNSVNIGVNTSPSSGSKLKIVSSEGAGLVVEESKTGNANTFGITSTANGSTTNAGGNKGVQGNASGNSYLNIGVSAGATGTSAKNIGLQGLASGGTANYGARLQDGTQGSGKFLKDVTGSGESNWSTIGISDITSLQTSLDAKLNKAGDTMTGALTVGSSFILTGTINSSLSGSNSRIPSHAQCNVTFTNSGLTSIASANNGGVVDGHTLFLTNATGNSITIVNNYGSAATGETIYTGTNTNVTVPDKGSFWLRWNTTANAWLCSSTGTFNIQDSQIASASTWNGKVTGNSAITGATKTKITYDSKGLVTAGADATTVDIADSTNKRYVTDAQLTVIGNTSGTNTGDQVYINPRVQSVASSATVTPTFSNELVTITAQAVNLTLANPTGTAIDGKDLIIRIKDNGTARTITFGAKFRAIGVTLPTTTVISKTMYLGVIYNATDDTFDIVGLNQQA